MIHKIESVQGVLNNYQGEQHNKPDSQKYNTDDLVYRSFNFEDMLNNAIKAKEDERKDILINLEMNWFKMGKILFSETGNDKTSDLKNFATIATNITDDFAKLLKE